MRIHREGSAFLIILLLILSAITISVWWLIGYEVVNYLVLGASVLIFLFFLQFFRNPKRNVEEQSSIIMAPADGKVVVIERTEEDEYLNRECIQISIFMSPLNVHVNRSPVTGQISYYKYHPGKYLVAWHPKSSTLNERNTIVFKTGGLEILMRQIAGAAARRIKCYAQRGEEYRQGDEIGFIKFGSRVDLFLPLDANILVEKGDITRGGLTRIAKISQSDHE